VVLRGYLQDVSCAGPDGCDYVSNNLTDNELQDWYGRRVSAIVRQRRIASERIDPQTARWIQSPIHFTSQKVGTAGAVEEVEKTDTARQWAPIAFVYALWIAIFTSSIGGFIVNIEKIVIPKMIFECF